MKNKNFAVFILTHGRPKKIYTLSSLKKCGYTGKIYFLCSTDDKTLDEYKKLYGEDVIVFNKEDQKGTFDIGDNFDGSDKVIVYARNANFEIAKKLGLTHFLQLDDDYTNFALRVFYKDEYRFATAKNLDNIFDIYLDFLKTTPAHSIAFAQGGDFIGGFQNAFFTRKIDNRKRKVMNSFFISVDKPFKFKGRLNEDVNCYVDNGKLGYLFFTHPYMSLHQPQTQSNTGGMTESYSSHGTYVKSFYTILFNPSSVQIRMMGDNHKRLHHAIIWKSAVPCIIPEGYKKQH